MSTFVEVPSAELLAMLREIGSSIEARGGRYQEGKAGREVVFDFVVPKSESVQTGHGATIRVFTTVSVGSVTARTVGRDAVRIVIGDWVDNARRPGKKRFHTIEKFRRIHRTAPKGDEASRVQAFLGRLKQALRDAYAIAFKAPSCPECSRPMALRKTNDGNREFYGCLRFPECRGTLPTGGY